MGVDGLLARRVKIPDPEYLHSYIIEPELVQAAKRLKFSPSETRTIFIPSCIFELKVSRMAPVITSWKYTSPLVEEEAMIFYWLTQAREVTAPTCPFSFFMGSRSFMCFMSQILTVLLTEPAAMNFDLGEKMQQFTEAGSSEMELYVISASRSFGEEALWREILLSCPQLAITLSGIKKGILV